MLVPSLSQLRPKASTLIACAVALTACSPATAHAVLAGTAGLLFELAPFALGVAWLETATGDGLRGRGRAGACGKALLESLGGCCSGRFPGALSAGAAGLCWATFGAPVALGRFAAAATASVALSHRAATACADPCGTRALGPLAVTWHAAAALRDAVPGAACGVLLAQVLATYPSIARVWPVGAAAGAALGLLLPCTTGAIALAAALRSSLPTASLAILLTAGMLPRGRSHCGAHRSVGVNGATVELALVGVACAWLVTRGGAGFVHPRIVPVLALAAIVAFATSGIALCRRGVAREGCSHLAARPLTVPCVLFTALILGSPVPQLRADETLLDGAFAGERVDFTGIATQRAGATVLVRYAITCCRADASPVALRLDRDARFANGTWLHVSGTLRKTPAGLALHPATLERIVAPGDPFVYR